MTFSFFLEAAFRSALLAMAVWTGLHVFRVRNVLAQKAAWGVVLAAALVMPSVLPMAAHWNVLPANVRVTIPADPENLLEELQARLKASPAPETKPPAVAAPAGEVNAQDQSAAEPRIAEKRVTEKPDSHAAATVATDSFKANSIEFAQPEPVPQETSAPILDAVRKPAAVPQRSLMPILTGLLVLYLAVAGVLLLRVLCGLIAALRLWRSAKPVPVHSLHSPLDLACVRDVRCSSRVGSPVTVFSSIILPANYASWDSETLRIVLAHERSHIRQGDFYLQMLAGVYAAAVWFSPLGWWLKRKLSDLAEAISDRAGLEEAADRTSYAQVLLEFAAAPRPTLIGVAMARSGSLSRRIERLLNDVSFRQSFSGSRRTVATVLVIPVVLFAASALVRVQAAGQAPAEPPVPAAAPDVDIVAPQAPAAPAMPEAGVSTPDQVAVPPAGPDIAPAAPRVPAPAGTPQAAPALPPAPASSADMVITPVAPPSGGMVLVAPRAPSADRVVVLPPPAPGMRGPTMAIIAPGPGYGEGYGAGSGQSASTETGNVSRSEHGKHSSYRYSYSSDGDSYAIVRSDGSGQMSFNGDIHSADIDRVRKQAHGDFLWFTHDGKSYFIDDPSTIVQIQAMYKPMEELGRQQEELGKRQEALGKQQEELRKQQENASVPTPDMSKEIAKIDEAMAKLKANQGKNMTQDQFAELQEKLGELQGRLGEIQGEIGEQQGKFGDRMGALGEKMGELGEQMGKLGEQQGRIAEEADRKVKSIIDQSLRNGKAHPVQ